MAGFDFTKLMSDPIALAGLGVASGDTLSDALKQGAVQASAYQKQQQDQADYQRLRQAEAVLPSLLSQVDLNKPNEAFKSLVQGGVDPKTALDLVNTIADNETNRMRMQSGGDLPSTIQIANEIQGALGEGTQAGVDRANLLMQIHKTFDRGVNPYTLQGNAPVAAPAAIPNYGSAVGDIAATKKGMEKKAEIEAGIAGEITKKSINATNSIDLIDKAIKLLPSATGSGVGNILSKGKGFVGYSSEQTQADADLDLIAGTLTSFVPRMEGPQSDRDTQMYKEMSANLGNKTKPYQDRLAAARTLKALQEKYAKLNKAEEFIPTGESVTPADIQGLSDEELLKLMVGK